MTPTIQAFPLRSARVHEACGPLAAGFAAVSAAQAGSVLWIREGWRPEMLGAAGLGAYLHPTQILLALTRDQTETLAVAEEGLRDGAVGLVVLELTAPIGLTPGRRLQLAAKDGGTTGLCLIPEGMGSAATETRWRCTARDEGSAAATHPGTPAPGEDSTLHHWELTRNKSGTVGAWHVRWSRSARHLIVVSPAGL